jgi:hypothetical protein
MSSGDVNLRAFIEGVEIPIISCQVSEQLWQVTSANLTVPYHRLGKQILARSVVHVFVKEPTPIDFKRKEAVESDQGAAGTFDGTNPLWGFFDTEDARRYRTFFWGEVQGDGSFRNPVSGQLTISAIGFSNYFDFIRQYQALRGTGSLSDEERRFAGVEDAFTSSSGRYASPDRIVNILRQAEGDLQTGIRDLLTEFVVRTNWFWKDRFALLRFEDLFRSVLNDDTAETLMDLRVFKKFIRNTIGRAGLQMNVRGILQTLGQFLFHDLIEHAAPTYFPYVSEEIFNTLSSNEYDETEPVVTRAAQVDQMTSLVYKPELWWTSPPACNILFPSQYSAESMTRDKISQPTRTVLKIRPGVSGSRRTIADRYFAPDTTALNSLVSSTPESEQHVFLLPHEKFQGINTNFVFLNEIARLTRRDSAQDYLRSYAQFMHWKTSYQGRQVTFDSQKILTQVLVGYPAVALDPSCAQGDWSQDPNLAEKIRLRRLLAALYACLERWERRLRRLRAELAIARAHLQYLDWFLWGYPSSAPNRSSSIRDLLAQSWNNNNEEPRFSISNAIQRMNQNRWRAVGCWTPSYDPEALERFFGEAGRDIIPSGSRDWITLEPSASNSGYEEYIEHLRGILLAYIDRLLRQIAEAEANIERLNEGIAWVNARLRELGWDTGQHEHVLFYVVQKIMQVKNDAESPVTRTSITGSFARVHDEDIDLDGVRGDSFEQVIKTGSGGFFSDMYAPDKIGQDFYYPLYGVESVVDLGAALGSEQASDEPPEAEADIGAEEQRWHDLILEICRDRSEDTETSGLTVKEALSAIVDTYRDLVTSGADPTRFVETATARPTATLFDMFGSGTLDQASQEVYGNHQGSNKPSGVGFHEFVFLQGNNTADTEEMFDTGGLEGGESDHLDVATARRQRVLEYVRALENEIQSGN